MNSIAALERYPGWEVVIGIEVHVQLTTESKIFCTCANRVAQEPNSNICQICSGYPGVLPIFNKKVLDCAITAGLATHCAITTVSEFARKHYFYPDLPKGYQITQSDKPICTEGYVTITREDGTKKSVRLIRIHMEEDAGKNLHGENSESFVDLNRAGTPLLEIVTYPDISSSYEARAYLKALRSIIMYLDISSGNMEEGALRADTNISVRKKGDPKLGTKVELKNINSFKFIGDAVEYEIERQIELLEQGQRVRQETRLWDTKEHVTKSMRSKEEAADYRYFPDPDLPLLYVDEGMIERLRATIPELPEQKFDRLVSQGLTPYEASIIAEDKELANYYDQASKLTTSKLLINWVLRDLMGIIKDYKISIKEAKITPAKLAQLIELIEKGIIGNRAAQEVFAIIAQTGQEPVAIVKERGLEQIGSTEELEAIVKDIIASNQDQVAQYKSGKDKLFGFFVGLAMQKTKGKGDPKIVNELLKKYLS